jgi:hypothetical protein
MNNSVTVRDVYWLVLKGKNAGRFRKKQISTSKPALLF